MSFAVLWIDRAHAKLFRIAEDRMERKSFDWSKPNHHTHRLKSQEKESPRFYEELAQAVEPDASILVIGPGVAKHHFCAHLKAHHPGLAGRVSGIETVDHPTDPQIAALATTYFGRLQHRA